MLRSLIPCRNLSSSNFALVWRLDGFSLLMRGNLHNIMITPSKNAEGSTVTDFGISSVFWTWQSMACLIRLKPCSTCKIYYINMYLIEKYQMETQQDFLLKKSSMYTAKFLIRTKPLRKYCILLFLSQSLLLTGRKLTTNNVHHLKGKSLLYQLNSQPYQERDKL